MRNVIAFGLGSQRRLMPDTIGGAQPKRGVAENLKDQQSASLVMASVIDTKCGLKNELVERGWS